MFTNDSYAITTVLRIFIVLMYGYDLFVIYFLCRSIAVASNRVKRYSVIIKQK